ncbi:MAG: ASCH domain-containing protein [Candidatus Levyibacteriota bacterium]
MNKTLKFAPPLVPLVLSGEKVSTWRLWDEKNLQEGDTVDFLNKETLKQFATAKLTKVIEKQLGELTDEDKKGHERFASDEEMYQTYTTYYKKEVNAQTPIKIIWFELA